MQIYFNAKFLPPWTFQHKFKTILSLQWKIMHEYKNNTLDAQLHSLNQPPALCAGSKAQYFQLMFA